MPATTRDLPDNDTPNSLLRKYDVSAPRYTSYPSIPFWKPTASDEVKSWLDQPQKAGESSLSLYVHIPFCASRCFYCGCYVVITSKHDRATTYVETVKAEMRLVRESMRETGRVRQFHLGGGTPTFITPGEMEGLVATAREVFPFESAPEMGIEIDPRTVDGEYLARLREMGFNRISMGVQDFDEKVMRTANRAQPFEMVAERVRRGRELGFRGINFDLIYGLPEQTVQSFEGTLEKVRQLGPDRLAVYSYAHLPRLFPYQRRFDPATLPGAEEKLALMQLTRRKLGEWGYVEIGMDHFARPGDDLAAAFREGTMRRNFMGYTTQAGTDQLAFGVSAISEFQRFFWQNEKKLNRYSQAVAAGRLPVARGLALSDEDLLRKALISALFCRGWVGYGEMGGRFGVSLQDHLASEFAALEPLAEDGLVLLEPDGLRVTPTGRLLLRNIAMVFDPYLKRAQGDAPRFSRAV